METHSGEFAVQFNELEKPRSYFDMVEVTASTPVGPTIQLLQRFGSGSSLFVVGHQR
jgi:hypothetical protein